MKNGFVLSNWGFFLDEQADCFKQNANFVPLYETTLRQSQGPLLIQKLRVPELVEGPEVLF